MSHLITRQLHNRLLLHRAHAAENLRSAGAAPAAAAAAAAGVWAESHVWGN